MLRYERSSTNDIKGLRNDLQKRGASDILVKLVLNIIEFAGATVRSSDIFGQNKSTLSMTKKFIKGLKVRIEIENIVRERLGQAFLLSV